MEGAPRADCRVDGFASIALTFARAPEEGGPCTVATKGDCASIRAVLERVWRLGPAAEGDGSSGGGFLGLTGEEREKKSVMTFAGFLGGFLEFLTTILETRIRRAAR